MEWIFWGFYVGLNLKVHLHWHIFYSKGTFHKSTQTHPQTRDQVNIPIFLPIGESLIQNTTVMFLFILDFNIKKEMDVETHICTHRNSIKTQSMKPLTHTHTISVSCAFSLLATFVCFLLFWFACFCFIWFCFITILKWLFLVSWENKMVWIPMARKVEESQWRWGREDIYSACKTIKNA